MARGRRRLIGIAVATALGLSITSVLGINLFNSRNSNTSRQDQGIIPLNEPRIIPDVPKDAIPPLYSPKYISAAEAVWLRPNDLILGYENNGDARAYPLLILNWHEIVNDNIGAKDVLVTYCPLCRSGIVFDRDIDGNIHSFGNTGALYESAMVMYDRETNSYWWQVGGISIKGPLEGKQLKLLPSVISTWEEWLVNHPRSLVLSRETGYARDYNSDTFAGYNRKNSPPVWPVSSLDDRLPPKEIVVGVLINGQARAYPISVLRDSVLMDDVGGLRVLVISRESSSYAAVFDARIDEEILDFKMDDDGKIYDKETGSVWNTAGAAIEGPLKGKRLVQIPNANEFWFAWALAHPDTDIGGI